MVWLCRQVPLCLLYGFFLVVLITPFVAEVAFAIIFFFLNVHVFLWMGKTAFFGGIGVKRTVQKWRARDWTKEVEAEPGALEVQHYVIIPNYKEDVEVLDATVRAVAESCLARRCIRVVLAMEQRDPTARETSKQLMDKWASHFLEILTTFHPPGLPLEVAGKSSNSAWAFQEVRKRAKAQKLDQDRTVIHVNDADCLWHPDYFSAVTLDLLR